MSFADDQENIAQRILEHIASLPLDKQVDAIHGLISSAIKEMPVEAIRSIRDEIAANFPADIAVVQSTLNLIDGQLALRDVMGGEAR